MKTYKNFYEQLSECRQKNNVRAIYSVLEQQLESNIVYVAKKRHWVYKYGIDARGILEIVAKCGEGFVVDICKKALAGYIMLSVKQCWYVAYALMKISDEQIAEYREWENAEIAKNDARIKDIDEKLDTIEENAKKEPIEDTTDVEQQVVEINAKIENETKTNDYKMEASEIRIINANQETGRVYFHTFDGRTICRTMQAGEIAHANRTNNLHGISAYKEEMVRLFNEVYSKPQKYFERKLKAYQERYEYLEWLSRGAGGISMLPDELQKELIMMNNYMDCGEYGCMYLELLYEKKSRDLSPDEEKEMEKLRKTAIAIYNLDDCNY